MNPCILISELKLEHNLLLLVCTNDLQIILVANRFGCGIIERNFPHLTLNRHQNLQILNPRIFIFRLCLLLLETRIKCC